jgi:hypothetical protein
MKKVLALVLILVFLASSSILRANPVPEAPQLQWSKNYVGTEGRNVIQTSDGGYLIVGVNGTQNALICTFANQG